MSRPALVCLLAGALVAALAAGCGPAGQAPQQAVAVGRTLPAFELPNLDGETVSSGELAGGRPIVLNFWATWCSPCVKELPALRELHASGAARVVSINVDSERDDRKVRDFVARHELGYEVLRADLSMVPRYGSQGIPYTLVLDATLTVRALHRSLVTRSALEAELRRLSADPAG